MIKLAIKRFLILLGEHFSSKLCNKFSLDRIVKKPQDQSYYDHLWLILKIWPYIYFNYLFSGLFERQLNELLKVNIEIDFREHLVQLIQLHYISPVLSLNFKDLSKGSIYRAHFAEMRYGAHSIALDVGNNHAEIIDNALSEMLCHDITYTWSNSPPFGQVNSYYSAKAFLYHVKRQIELLK